MAQAWDPIAHTPLRAVSDFGTLNPGAFFCKPDGGSYLDGWKIYKFEGAWTADNLPAFAVQLNLDWHGGGETLSWRGPPSRYFEIHHADETGFLIPAVSRKGASWTWAHRSPDITLGCAIMESGGVKYLNLAHRPKNSLGTIYFSQRVFSETYTNNSPYDAGTNPLGWVSLPSVVLPGDANRAATPVFFNANGTECQCIIGLSTGTAKPITTAKRLKVAIGVGSATPVVSSAAGDITRDEVIVDTGSTGYSVAFGIDDGEGNVTPECIAYDEEGACIHSKYDYTTNNSGSKGGSLTINVNTSPVQIVDYKGNVEITAAIYDTENSSSSRNFTNTTHRTFNQIESDPPDITEELTESYNGTYTTNAARKLVSPNLSMDLQTVTGSRSAAWNRNTTAPVPDSVSDTSNTTWTQRLLVYLDLRAGHAIYVEKETITQIVATGEFFAPDSTPHNKTETINTRFVVVLNGQTTVVAENLGTPVFTAGVAVFPPLLEFWGGVGDHDSSSSSSTIDPIGDAFSHLVMHQQSVYGRLGICGVATDAANNVLLSVTIWDDGAEDGYYTFLTGGDALNLIGATGIDRRLIEVGLIDFDGSYVAP